jgi:hypothetical protein
MFNMMSPLPPVAEPHELKGLLNLIELVSDPGAARKRVAALVEPTNSLRAAHAEARGAHDALAVAKTEHDAALAKARTEHDAALADSRAAHDAMVASRSADLTAREVAVAARENKVKADETAQATAKADLDRRLEHLKKAASAA